MYDVSENHHCQQHIVLALYDMISHWLGLIPLFFVSLFTGLYLLQPLVTGGE